MIDPDDASILLTTSHGRTADEPLEPEGDDSLVGDGEIWGDFRIGRMLGRGGMGTVYLAHQLSMDRDVALKVLPPRLGDSEDFKRRFQLEAQVVGRISSPHVVQIHAAGVHLDHHWFAMEYVDGCDLASRLYDAQRPRPTALESIDLVAQAARGLVVAAEHDVVHRDIKPGNLMISAKGVVKLMDFGLLRIAREDISATVTGVVMGTVGYLSPEQARGERCDQRTDIYSLGVVLYELLTGQLPFNGEASVVIHHHIHTAPTRPREIDPTISTHLEAVVLTCLAKRPDERYPSAAHLLSDLEALQEDREPALALALRRRSWHWWLVTALLASTLAVFIAIAARPTRGIVPAGSSPAASDVAAASARPPVEPPCAPETVAASAVTCVCGSAIAVPAPFIGGDVVSYSWSIDGERGRCGWLDSRDSTAPKTTWTAPGRAGASTLHVVAHDRRGVSHEATVPLIAVAAAADAPRSLQVFLRRDWSFPAMTRLVEHPLGGWWAIESDHLLHVDARFSNPARIPLADDAAGRHPIAVRSWHGDLYVLTASQVMVFAADGSCTRTLLSSELGHAVDVALADDGAIVVSDSERGLIAAANDGVIRARSQAERDVARLAIASDGSIAALGAGILRRFRADLTPQEAWPIGGDAIDLTRHQSGLAVVMRDGSVRILAADGSVAQVSPAAGLGKAVPEAIASSATGHLLVSWPGIHLVTRVDAAGQPAGARGAELKDGSGWCADGLGQVYAVDADGALGIFDVDGWCRLRLGARERAADPRPDPMQIAASFDGRFVASIDRERHAVLRFNVEEPNHAPLLVAGATGSAIAMAQPAGVTMDEESRIYALDRDTGTIAVCDSSGALCFQFGGWGREPGRFKGPLRFAVSPRGGVAYVLDDGRGELVKFLLDHGRRNATVAASESMPALASEFIPGCDRQGLLYVVDGSRDLRVLDWRSHRPETIFHERLEALGAPSATAMAVSPDGQVYFSGASGVVGLRW